MLLSTALYQQPYQQVSSLSSGRWAGLPSDEHSALASYLFWFIGTPVAFVVIGLWYQRRAQRTGIRVPWRWFAGVGLGLLVGLALLAAIPVDPQTAAMADQIAPTEPSVQWLRAFRTPLIPIAAAVAVLGWVERSRWLIAAGAWLGLLAWWQQYFHLGGIPGWMDWLLSGGEGPALGGEITLLGLNRPGPVLILATLPLLVFAAVRAARSREPR
ncbi:hypothetical protein [Actinoplanes sp. NPDC049118]|uniref:hypothetical protein n=1 Tax=Actinoplanes sp. NPDC049118 TaxID=3155769 RepID=UPI0033E51B6C